MQAVPGHVTAVFQTANDLIESAAAEADVVVDFICECGDATCLASVPLTVRDYRAHRRFHLPIVCDGHDAPYARPSRFTLA